jgi:hypothetical protein
MKFTLFAVLNMKNDQVILQIILIIGILTSAFFNNRKYQSCVGHSHMNVLSQLLHLYVELKATFDFAQF